MSVLDQESMNKLLDGLAVRIGQLEVNNLSLKILVESQQKEIEELKSLQHEQQTQQSKQ